ncbi:MAG TPA: hypothetical protein PLC40_03100 [Candidatus Hydrogenedentes bacterium]|nr:hypothetical protein [Candidatus Hydrogenedentota bacterium]
MTNILSSPPPPSRPDHRGLAVTDPEVRKQRNQHPGYVRCCGDNFRFPDLGFIEL